MRNLILCALFIILSCSPSDDIIHNNVDGLYQPKGKLKKLESESKEIDENGNEFIYTNITYYSYNNIGYINRAKSIGVDGSEYIIVYNYNGEQISNISSYHNGVIISTTEFTYNGINITKSVTTENNYIDERSYIYNSNGELFKEVYKVNGNLNSETYFEHQGGNIIKKTNNSYINNSYVIEYVHDNKNNPITNSFPKSFLKIMYEGVNNIIMENNNIISYEYNYNDFPILKRDGDYSTKYFYY